MEESYKSPDRDPTRDAPIEVLGRMLIGARVTGNQDHVDKIETEVQARKKRIPHVSDNGGEVFRQQLRDLEAIEKEINAHKSADPEAATG
jgi:hypothetical protein